MKSHSVRQCLSNLPFKHINLARKGSLCEVKDFSQADDDS